MWFVDVGYKSSKSGVSRGRAALGWEELGWDLGIDDLMFRSDILGTIPGFPDAPGVDGVDFIEEKSWDTD